MKKSLIVLGALFIFAFLFTGCPKEAIEEDGSINMTTQVNDVVLKYNDWGTTFYSYLQSDTFDISDLFTDGLPKANDSVKYYWKGKSNRDIKNLYMLVADITWQTDENGNKKEGTETWRHLLTEKQKSTPIATNIKAGEEFEIKGNLKLDFDSEHTVFICLCCSTEDTDGPVHLYSTDTENTEKYDEYMTNTGNAIMNSSIKVEKKGKIEVNKESKTVSFKDFPKIKFADGITADGSTDDGKKELLDKGYFFIHFWGDELNDFCKTISNSEKNTCNHGGWDGTDKTFVEYNISDRFKEEITGEPIYGECAYFALAAENISGTTKEDDSHYYYFPVVAFDVEIK